MNEKSVMNDPFVFPNPSAGVFRIVLPVSSAIDYEMQIFNSSGVKVINQQIHGNGNIFYQMDLTSLPRGIYFIRLTDGKITCQNKIVLL